MRLVWGWSQIIRSWHNSGRAWDPSVGPAHRPVTHTAPELPLQGRMGELEGPNFPQVPPWLLGVTILCCFAPSASWFFFGGGVCSFPNSGRWPQRQALEFCLPCSFRGRSALPWGAPPQWSFMGWGQTICPIFWAGFCCWGKVVPLKRSLKNGEQTLLCLIGLSFICSIFHEVLVVSFFRWENHSVYFFPHWKTLKIAWGIWSTALFLLPEAPF